jgi:hypothetical protein
MKTITAAVVVASASSQLTLESGADLVAGLSLDSTTGTLKLSAPCVDRSNWCGNWKDNTCEKSSGAAGGGSVQLGSSAASIVLFSDGALVFNSSQCVGVDLSTPTAEQIAATKAANHAQLIWDEAPSMARVHTDSGGKIWIQALSLVDAAGDAIEEACAITTPTLPAIVAPAAMELEWVTGQHLKSKYKLASKLFSGGYTELSDFPNMAPSTQTLSKNYVDQATTGAAATQEITLSVWVKTTEADPATAPLSYIIGQGMQTSNGEDVNLYLGKLGNGKFSFGGFGGAMHSDTGSPGAAHASDITVQTGRWYHLTATYKDKIPKIYVDGQFAGMGTDIGTKIYSTAEQPSQTDIMLGRSAYAPGSSHWMGSMKKIQMWNTAFTEHEVRELHELTTCTNVADAQSGQAQNWLPDEGSLSAAPYTGAALSLNSGRYLQVAGAYGGSGLSLPVCVRGADCSTRCDALSNCIGYHCPNNNLVDCSLMKVGDPVDNSFADRYMRYVKRAPDTAGSGSFPASDRFWEVVVKVNGQGHFGMNTLASPSAEVPTDLDDYNGAAWSYGVNACNNGGGATAFKGMGWCAGATSSSANQHGWLPVPHWYPGLTTSHLPGDQGTATENRITWCRVQRRGNTIYKSFALDGLIATPGSPPRGDEYEPWGYANSMQEVDSNDNVAIYFGTTGGRPDGSLPGQFKLTQYTQVVGAFDGSGERHMDNECNKGVDCDAKCDARDDCAGYHCMNSESTCSIMPYGRRIVGLLTYTTHIKPPRASTDAYGNIFDGKFEIQVGMYLQHPNAH